MKTHYVYVLLAAGMLAGCGDKKDDTSGKEGVETVLPSQVKSFFLKKNDFKYLGDFLRRGGGPEEVVMFGGFTQNVDQNGKPLFFVLFYLITVFFFHSMVFAFHTFASNNSCFGKFYR